MIMAENTDKTMIQVDESLRDALKDLKRDGESYNDVIRRMEKNYNKYLDVKELVLDDISPNR